MCGEVRYLAWVRTEGDIVSSKEDPSSSDCGRGVCGAGVGGEVEEGEEFVAVSACPPTSAGTSVLGSDSRLRGVSSEISRYRIGPAFIMSVTDCSLANVAMKAFGTGEMILCYLHVNTTPHFNSIEGAVYTFKNRNMVTSPNLSKTRRTSRCSLKFLGGGKSLRWTVRAVRARDAAAREEDIVVSSK